MSWGSMLAGRRPVTLAGGFCCELTDAEQNAWSVYMYNCAAGKRLLAANDLVAHIDLDISLLREVTHERLTEARDEVRAARREMFDAASEWYAELRKDDSN